MFKRGRLVRCLVVGAVVSVLAKRRGEKIRKNLQRRFRDWMEDQEIDPTGLRKEVETKIEEKLNQIFPGARPQTGN